MENLLYKKELLSVGNLFLFSHNFNARCRGDVVETN